MKSPLVDVLAFLMCILMVVAIGQYYIHKKEKEVVVENTSIDNRVDKFKFETVVKTTE